MINWTFWHVLTVWKYDWFWRFRDRAVRVILCGFLVASGRNERTKSPYNWLISLGRVKMIPLPWAFVFDWDFGRILGPLQPFWRSPEFHEILSITCFFVALKINSIWPSTWRFFPGFLQIKWEVTKSTWSFPPQIRGMRISWNCLL